MCTNNTPSSFHAVKIFHGPSQVEGSSLGLWEGVLGEALLRRENTSGTVALGSIPPQQYHATTLDKDTHSKRCRLMPSAGATAQKHMAKNTPDCERAPHRSRWPKTPMRSCSRAPDAPCSMNDAHHARAGCPPREMPVRLPAPPCTGRPAGARSSPPRSGAGCSSRRSGPMN